MGDDDFRIELGDWAAMRSRAAPVRFTVFVEEQKVPAEIELDEFDPHCVHALAIDGRGRVLGTGRLLPDGHVGRMAVLREARGRGVGSALLLACLHAMAAAGYAYAIVGGAGDDAIYRDVAGAVAIDGSTPGIYRDRLARPESPA